MSKPYAPKGSERSSFPHQDERLRAQNPLYGRVEPIARPFETERCSYHAKVLAQEGMTEAERRLALLKKDEKRSERRSSFMVKRSQPKLLLRPPRLQSYGPDAAQFAAQAEKDHAEALRTDDGVTDQSMMMQVFRKSQRKTFLEKRLAREGFDLKDHYRHQARQRDR